jgi:predicted CxxxxCH...CXXCH cytochrome family protein
VCHQDKSRQFWPNPGDPDGNEYKHQNGSRHYFNPNNDPCSDPNTCIIDYRGTDCTGCHIHDPGPAPDPNDPDYDDEIRDSRSAFNSKAFAPTCRCHGIGRIDIVSLEYDPNEYRGEGPLPDIAGKGHGTSPPPFPIVDPSLTEKDPNQDVHMAHALYNFPCLRCHIDPDDLPYDPNNEYIFKLDGNTPIGFDQLMNPNGSYEESTGTCSNLYCHSNGKGGYAESIAWSGTERFCRDPNNPDCLDDYEYFLYCDSCHKTPPDPNDTCHSSLNISCDTCHPHNSIYEGKPGFYKHVNGKVDYVETFEINMPMSWSMISLPMAPNNATLSALFPEAEVVYKFERTSGYVRVKENEELQIGVGYWILFNEDRDYVITGQPICSYSKTVYSDGWEMIGGCTFQGKAFVDNGNISVIYSYVQGEGYVRLLESENLTPGEGYWILINDVIDKAVLTVKPVGF